MMNPNADQSGSPYGVSTPRGSTPRDSTPRSPFSPFSPLSGDERHRGPSDMKFQRASANSGPHDPLSPGSMHQGGHKFHEVFQMKQGRYDLHAAKISEMMKSNSLDNAPTQSLLSVVNGILDESIERKNGEIPQRVACLLRKVVQEIERRISTQAEHLRTQNNLFKAREEKYQSRINVLEALASGTREENEIATNQLQQIKTEKFKLEEKKKNEEEDMVKLMKENHQHNDEIAALRQELEVTRKAYEQQCSETESQTKVATTGLEERLKELEQVGKEANTAKTALGERVKELEKMIEEASVAKKSLEEKVKMLEQMGKETNAANTSLEVKIQELEQNLVHWKGKVKEIEAKSASKDQSWSHKEHSFRSFIKLQFQALQELRSYSKSIKQEILKAQENYSEEFNRLGKKLIELGDAAENYHAVLAENRKLFNELQELKGNIRVYCRVRPFLPGQSEQNTVTEYIGKDGELVVTNPTRPGKDGLRQFRFNKVYSPASTQAEVFSDVKPLIRSVLDGYNVCIFAYGQTGSGKTYTMSGPDGATEEEWGVNYRALNDLFSISQSRKSTITYEVGVQMVEIYNEQVRDLLSDDRSQKKLGILSTTQQNGLAVPDASMYPVLSTSDVLELMDIGLNNRAVGSTAMNERSSRSHSIVTVHVCGKDLKTGSTLYGNLHLVDLAGSERVDRSEVTGDRLREAQHINKSLSALGDVIFSLASKNAHVPYRNSKLTQLLQSSLGGRAKTLMFVQLNPDVTSYSETMSTLKFAERVSGVELGAAKSSKEGRDVRDLMDQLASLKDTIAKKDDEIERLHLLRDIKDGYPKKPENPQRRKSLEQAEDDYQAVNDVESIGSVEVESDERMSEASDGVASVGTEGSVDVARSMDGRRLSKVSDRTKLGTRTTATRPVDKLRQVGTKTTALAKTVRSLSPGLRKTGSSSSLLKSSTSKRWQ
ncbi:PREDICTED: kinesin-like protein KIN-14G isoform X2 [Tarenaya hassleriana]|uniref:kinesin-like protein KIN-14G isoform X2 n=1 Tax=Tarenaya hassleriana TaxID=28532 RepID=UPI00053C758B|nr:PREDICTED: kinesin-like protein KIN-14G isoform X2 [Tarenaya hassleriana]